MKKNKLVLDIAYDFDFVLLGVISAARDFTLAWSLNKYLDIHLAKQDDINYKFIKNDNFYISNYIFETEYSMVRLLKNRAIEFFNIKKPYLLPELKRYDYFVVLNGEFAAYYKECILKMQLVPEIQYINQIDYEALPSKENLLI